MPLDRIHAPGNLTIRALATHVIGFTSYSGIKGVPNVELAGQNSGGSGTFGNTPELEAVWHPELGLQQLRC